MGEFTILHASSASILVGKRFCWNKLVWMQLKALKTLATALMPGKVLPKQYYNGAIHHLKGKGGKQDPSGSSTCKSCWAYWVVPLGSCIVTS